jgi:protein TonB
VIATAAAISHEQESQYQQQLRQLIESAKHYPMRARRMGYEGVVNVAFVVLRNGEIRDIHVTTSSGNAILDSAAKKSVDSASGKLPFPQHIQRERWDFTVGIEYRLH